MPLLVRAIIALYLLPVIANADPLASVTPSPRTVAYEWMSVDTWYRHHADDVEASRTTPAELVFIGDSITESWAWSDAYTTEFNRYFGQYRTVNLAIGGDKTENLLWRLTHGAAGNLNPKVVVLMIGTNNLGLGNQTSEQTALGVGAVIQQLQASFANAHIVCLGILPYDEKATSPNRARVKKANSIIAQLANNSVSFYDFGQWFVDDQGTITTTLMYDFLHPTPKGMSLLGAKLQPVLAKYLQ